MNGIGVNCATHPKVEAVAKCAKCGKPICPTCYDAFELPNNGGHVCADCYKKAVRSEISEIDSLKKMTKREIGFIIFGFVFGFIVDILLFFVGLNRIGIADVEPLLNLMKASPEGLFYLIPLVYIPFALGSLMTVLKRVFRVFRATNDGSEDSWIWALVFAIIAGWFMLLVTPIITIYRFVVRIKDKNRLNVILANDQQLLTAIDNFIAETLKPSAVEQAAAGGDVEISLDAILASSAGSDAALCDNGEILRTIRTR